MRPEFVFFSNRAASVFTQALEPIGGRVFDENQARIDLLYFDQYGGKTPPTDIGIGSTLINRRQTIPLDNKAQMARWLQHAGINFPRVYFSVEVLPNEPDSLWFVKDPLTAGGKGMSVGKKHDIKDKFKQGLILQEAVQDLALIDGCKFTLREYLLVHQGQLFLFQRGITVKHGREFSPNSVDPAVQYEHADYMNKDSDVEIRPAVELSYYPQLQEYLTQYLPVQFGAFSKFLKSEPQNTYCLFGIDLLVRSDLSCVLIEINDRPNLKHTALVNEQVNVPMLRAMAKILLPMLESTGLNEPSFRKILKY